MERISNVLGLRAAQFTEDSGPLAHPVRPEKYIEINNFYTATVYEKGAEVIRMLHILAGPAGYRKALDLYFERHDGQACTIEDFAQVFEDACNLDLSQFKRWWSQAGTPQVTIAQTHDAESGRLSLTFTQETPPTPGQPEKAPQHMPVLLGFIGPNGESVALPGADADGSVMVELREATQTVSFEAIPAGSVLSAFRGFSAPVIVRRDVTNAERARLLANDPDSFNRWEAGREIAREALLRLYADPTDTADADAYVDAMAAAFSADMDPAFKALLMSPPAAHELAGEIAARGEGADPEAIYAAQVALRDRLAERLAAPMAAQYDALADDGPFSPDHASAGRRTLRNACLGLLTSRRTAEDFARAERQFEAATNMTDSLAALAALHSHEAPAAETALKTFYDRWRHDALTLDKWFAVQAMAPRTDAIDRVRRLAKDPAFNWRNPNRFRSLFGAFAGNHRQFHAADGSGYDLLAEQLIRLDAVNPQTAARMATAFELWRRYEPNRQAMMRAAVDRLLATEPLSRDLYEIATRIAQAA